MSTLDYLAHTHYGMVSKSMLMHECVFNKIRDVAPVDVTVLILGETGSGKEMTANAIYENSGRRSKPYTRVNCASIPEGVAESELFGHVRGAYTGAYTSRKGKFRESDGGTIFLDEIGSMPKDSQSRLLRVLEDMIVTPVGSDKGIKADVRVIAATNQDLYAAVRWGAFRRDLYYRLSAITIRIPPLRERIGDIPMLIKYFMDKYQAQYGKSVPEFTPMEYIAYFGYVWPGNVRELEGAIKDIVIFGIDKIEKLEQLKKEELLLSDNTLPNATYDISTTAIGGIKHNAILKALARNNGNRTHTARELGVNVRTIRNHIRKMKEEMKLEQLPETDMNSTKGLPM